MLVGCCYVVDVVEVVVCIWVVLIVVDGVYVGFGEIVIGCFEVVVVYVYVID